MDGAAELLERGDSQRLAELARRESRVRRFLTARLWDAGPAARVTAARSLGYLAAAHGAVGAELLRRFMWALNEESGTSGAAVVPAVVEIATCAPSLLAPHLGALVEQLDDEGLRDGLILVFEALANRSPTLLAAHGAALARWCARCAVEQRLRLEKVVAIVEGGRQ